MTSTLDEVFSRTTLRFTDTNQMADRSDAVIDIEGAGLTNQLPDVGLTKT